MDRGVSLASLVSTAPSDLIHHRRPLAVRSPIAGDCVDSPGPIAGEVAPRTDWETCRPQVRCSWAPSPCLHRRPTKLSRCVPVLHDMAATGTWRSLDTWVRVLHDIEGYTHEEIAECVGSHIARHRGLHPRGDRWIAGCLRTGFSSQVLMRQQLRCTHIGVAFVRVEA